MVDSAHTLTNMSTPKNNKSLDTIIGVRGFMKYLHEDIEGINFVSFTDKYQLQTYLFDMCNEYLKQLEGK